MNSTTDLKLKEKMIIKFYNLVADSEIVCYTEIPPKIIRYLSCIPASSLAIPLCIDLLDQGKSLAEASRPTGLTVKMVRTVRKKLK